jgi:hypothetical protein
MLVACRRIHDIVATLACLSHQSLKMLVGARFVPAIAIYASFPPVSGACMGGRFTISHLLHRLPEAPF